MTIRLSENLRRLRRQAGLPQAALAAQLGVSDRAVSRWERNEALPDLALLPQLALLLDVSTDALLGVDPAHMEAEILQATEECTALLNRDDAPAAIALLRFAVFPIGRIYHFFHARTNNRLKMFSHIN